MKLTLLIGPSEKAANRFRVMFKEHATALQTAGIEVPEWNHVRLYAACAEPDEISVLRHKRGLDHPLVGQVLRDEIDALLAQDIAHMQGDHVVLAAAQLGSLLHDITELERLRALLAPHFDTIQIVAHVEEQARALTQHYITAVIEGRRLPLSADIALAQTDDWWDSALACRTTSQPYFGLFNDVQAPPFWLDYDQLVQAWGFAFGQDNVTLRPLDLPHLMSEAGMDEVCTTLGIKNTFGKTKPGRLFAPEPAASLTRMRHMNEVMIRYAQARDVFIPYEVKTQILKAVRTDGPPIAPGSLCAISDSFAADNAMLVHRFPALQDALTPDAPQEPWTEADPTMGFRASQYLAAFVPAIDKNAVPLAQKRAEHAQAETATTKFETLVRRDETDPVKQAQKLARLKVNHQMILSSPFKPHNSLGKPDEMGSATPYAAISPHALPKGSTGNVIVACMKNEAPYIIEWIAHHRAIGVDHFLIYTNDCTDGTDDILGRLDAMGIIHHRNNNTWRGNSPQQHALNQALDEPVVKDAAWIAHIDVDEFINVRTGNGTLDDLFDATPDATNIAMTWRLFGHNDVSTLHDSPVTAQFETCAPKFCPKPHTAWGYKTLFRNIGAYAKMSCHRPNKLNPDAQPRVKWVNGSGADMTGDALKNGWRSSKSNIGYDLVQLNHYALRSAESFLIKRQRGRALHVDRSIGLNYWVRMDWSDVRDTSIQRNQPRVQTEYARLMQDDLLRAAHDAGFKWHQAKAAELRGTPEFAELYAQATSLKLNAAERAAYALSLDMES